MCSFLLHSQWGGNLIGAPLGSCYNRVEAKRWWWWWWYSSGGGMRDGPALVEEYITSGR